MSVADNAAGGIDADIKFFFLQWTKKSRAPVPDVNFVRHHLIGLLQADFAFEVCFRRVIQIKNDARIVTAELRALRGRKLFGNCESVRAGDFEFDGSLGESSKEIGVRHARAENARENPEQENFCVFLVEPFERQTRLLWRQQMQSIFSHAAGECKSIGAARSSSTGTLACANFAVVAKASVPDYGLQNRTGKSACATKTRAMI